MDIKKKIKELNILFVLKTGVGSAMAILVADRFNLAYSASAGIITLLTIQNTKKETIFIALRRILGFFMAVIIAYTIFTRFGYTSIAFGGFVFVFVGLCNIFGLQDSISMNAVLTTHFLIEKRMDLPFIMNEIYLLIIGMSIGIIINLIMPKNKEKIQREQKIVENKIRATLSCMAKILDENLGSLCSDLKKANIDFDELDSLLEDLLSKAYEDAGNKLLSDTKYQISYLEMRKLQIVVLKDIFKNIKQIHDIPSQSNVVSQYMERVADQFHELNNVKGLLIELEELYEFFRNERLPVTRNEFENRAILFRILKDLQNFLEIKRSFVMKSLKE